MRAPVRPDVVAAFASAVLVGGCTLFSQTPDPGRRAEIRARVPYGASVVEAESRLSGLGFGCTRRKGEFIDERGAARSAPDFLYCQERPGVVSFACQNRDQVTVVVREDKVSGIEVRRGPSCDQTSPEALKIK